MVGPQQFDVCHVRLPNGGSAVELAVVLQHDVLSDLATRIVAPLIMLDEPFVMDRAAPMVQLHGEGYIVAVHLLTTLPNHHLGRPIANLRDQDAVLKRAIDMIFIGI